jgi:hypothetical protein
MALYRSQYCHHRMDIKSEMKNMALFRGPVEKKCEIESPFYEGAYIGNVPS